MKMFTSLKNPVFRLYYGAMLSQRAALNMQLMVRSYLIYELTNSYTLLGLMNLAYAIPLLITSLFGGVLADRLQKKTNMLMGQVVSAATFLAIAICLTSGYVSAEHDGSWWVLMAAAIINGAFGGIMMPSRHAIIPEIVGERNITNAIALNSLAMNLLRFVGPMAAGFIIGVYGVDVVYYVMATIAVIGIIFVVVMPITSKVIQSNVNVLGNIREGFGYIWQKKIILFLLMFVLFSIMLSRPAQVLLPAFAKDILKVDATGLGWLMAVGGVGATVGSLVLASLPDRKRGLIMLVGALGLGTALIGFAFSSSWYQSLILMFIVGLGLSIRMTLGNTLIQHYTESKYRGRVMSIYTMDFAFTSVGIAIAALIAESVGIQWVVSSFAVILIVISLLVVVFVPKVRRLN
jgi:MFS family permease